jgi:serine/threonine protein phosphatase PrpC
VTEQPPQGACKALVDIANERGGEDNITVVVVKIVGVDAHLHPLIRFVLKLLQQTKKYLSDDS